AAIRGGRGALPGVLRRVCPLAVVGGDGPKATLAMAALPGPGRDGPRAGGTGCGGPALRTVAVAPGAGPGRRMGPRTDLDEPGAAAWRLSPPPGRRLVRALDAARSARRADSRAWLPGDAHPRRGRRRCPHGGIREHHLWSIGGPGRGCPRRMLGF